MSFVVRTARTSDLQALYEMAKLTGQLRDAVDGNDTRGIRDTVREMEALSSRNR